MPEQLAPDITLEFTHRVRQADVDRVVRSSKVFLKDGWARATDGGRLLADLSRVEFIDFGAAARILAVIEGCARFGWQVTVQPPALIRRVSEEAFLTASESDPRFAYYQQSVSRQVRRRRRAHAFLRNSGFFQALEMPHLTNVVEQPRLSTADRPRLATPSADDDTPITSESEIDGASATADDAPRPTILPFRWVSQADQTMDWQTDFVSLLSTQLTRTDSESLVRHVVNELIDNVREHAVDDGLLPPWALVGAMVFNSRGNRYLPKPEMFYPASGEYLKWLADQTTPIVRLLVVDSGRGLTATIGREFAKQLSRDTHIAPSGAERTHAIALYAFGAGTSRFGRTLGRGIGLPAVRRFVRSYRGLIAVRAANISSGYACHHGSLNELKNDALTYAPGTAIEIILGLSLGARAQLDDRAEEGIEPVTLIAVEAKASAMSDISRTVDAAIQEASPRHPVVLLSLYGWPRERRAAFKQAISISGLANGLAGRAGLAIFLPELPASEFESTFGAVDELRERSDQAMLDSFRIPNQSTPFMVVPSNGREYWSGGTRELRKLLYGLSKGERLDDSGHHREDSDLDYLMTERDWLVRKDGTLRLRLQPGDIDNKVAEGVAWDIARTLGLRPRSPSGTKRLESA